MSENQKPNHIPPSSTSSPVISVVGGGMAGTECALQLADRGHQVVLYEMRKSGKLTPAHKTQEFAELVCSNSLGSIGEVSGPGQLKWEAQQLGSHILEAAIQARVPAGQALGVDRLVFSELVSEKIRKHPNIRVEAKVVESLSEIPRPTVIATGPLTDESLAKDMMSHLGDQFLYFFDAIAPIIDAETIDTKIAWKADRWDKGTGDYYNCPMDKEQYLKFIDAVRASRKVEPKEFEKTPYFESCLPIEVLAERGVDTPRFGPMSPKGIFDPKTGRRPYAVVQLRQDNQQGTAYNIVGFQTKMAYGDQKEVFRLIPGLENAEFLKLGSIHRNLYINSPKKLTRTLASRSDENLFFAGQITGVEGYFESTCMGLLVALFLNQKIKGHEVQFPPRETAMGSLLHAITLEEKDNFQPTNINFSLFPRVEGRMQPRERKELQVKKARHSLSQWIQEFGLANPNVKASSDLALPSEYSDESNGFRTGVNLLDSSDTLHSHM